MSNLSLAERLPATALEPDEPIYGPCFSSTRPPLPMGCAMCGHPPYAHGCDHMGAHEYEAPSRRQIDARWDLIRSARLDELGMPARDWVRPNECAPQHAETEDVPAAPAELDHEQPAPAVSAPRQAEPATAPYPAPARPFGVRPATRTDGRRSMMPSRAHPHRPVETRENRAVRLALAREPLARRRARIMAAEQEHTPYRIGIGAEADVGNHFHPGGPPPSSTGREAEHLRPGELAIHRTIARPPDIPGSVGWRPPYELAGVAA